MATSLYPEQLLKRRVLAWALELNVNPKRVDVLPMPEKWGCCNTDGVVVFADDLTMADSDFQDYVIVHELLHLRYRTHGKRFHAMMNAMVPRWRELAGRRRDQLSDTPLARGNWAQ